LDLLVFVTDHAASIWAVFAVAMSGLGGWLLSMRRISATVERTRIATRADISSAEAGERAAFRTALMTEVSEMRRLMKESENEKEGLRQRLNVADGQILVLKASNEIMERWIAFFNERGMSAEHLVHADHLVHSDPQAGGFP
jgi:hypothetical protein